MVSRGTDAASNDLVWQVDLSSLNIVTEGANVFVRDAFDFEVDLTEGVLHGGEPRSGKSQERKSA